MNRNIKLFPPYVALTWDVFFVWTISIMFFTTQKGLSYSQAVMLDSFLMLFAGIFALIVPKIFAKVPALRSTQIGLIGYAGYVLLCIFGQSYFVFIVANIFLGFGYSMQAVKGNLVLTQSLSIVKRDKDYQRVYGNGMSIYYIAEAISSIVVTYIYSWNAYLAYWLSFALVVLTFLYSLLLKEPVKYQERNIEIEDQPVKKTQNADSYIKILSSGFIIAMLAYMFFFRGALAPSQSAAKMYFQMLIEGGKLPMWAFGFIFAAIRLASALSSKYQFKYDLKFGVKSLLIFNTILVLAYTVNGALFLIAPYSVGTIITIIILTILQCSLRQPNQIFINKYIQVCAPKKNHEKIYALKLAMEYGSYALLSFMYAGILSGFNDNYGLTLLTYVGIVGVPVLVTMIVFIRLLCKKYAESYTIIRKEYTED